jgi:hypothetical protein
MCPRGSPSSCIGGPDCVFFCFFWCFFLPPNTYGSFAFQIFWLWTYLIITLDFISTFLLLSLYYSWQTPHVALNNNHSLTRKCPFQVETPCTAHKKWYFIQVASVGELYIWFVLQSQRTPLLDYVLFATRGGPRRK